jgi:hypothetical protein
MRFALITEGASEHRIVKHIIIKYFKDQEPEINQIQPKVIKDRQETVGGWNEVLKYCERDELNDILIENDYLVIQIDTDQSQTSPFNVSHSQPDGRQKTSEELYADVIQKLKGSIKPEILIENETRIFFAICIHTIECWLLPACYSDHHRTNTNNCLSTLNTGLRRKNMPTISPTGKNTQNGKTAYKRILTEMNKKSDIITSAVFNFGFQSFIQSLDQIQIDEA